MYIRVFLVEEQPVLCLGICTILKRASDIQVVGESSQTKELQPQITAAKPDVIILAHTLSENSSLSVAKTIIKMDLSVQILAYGRVVDDRQVKDMLAAGAMGYALTTDAPNLLITAIRTIAVGRIWLSPGIEDQTFQRIDRELAHLPPLTQRECEILKLIGEGYGNHAIAEILHLEWQTVKNYIYRLYQKLGVNSRSQAMLRAIRMGLVNIDEGLSKNDTKD